MITAEKLKIYKHFRGDRDAWARRGVFGYRDQMTDRDWTAIDELLQSLKIIQDGQATSEFAAQTNARIDDLTENEDVCIVLRELARHR
jgi:hypothetical protein